MDAYFQSDTHKIDALSGGIVIYTSHCTQITFANQVFYDYVCLSLPIQKIHEEGACDPVMMERMKEILK